MALVPAAAATDVSPPRSSIFAVEHLVAAHLLDKQRFGLDTLPHHGVVAGFGDVVEDVDLVVLVALAQDSTFARCSRSAGRQARLRGAERASRDCTLVPVLHLPPLGATDENRYFTAIALCEQGFQLCRVACFVDESDSLGRFLDLARL